MIRKVLLTLIFILLLNGCASQYSSPDSLGNVADKKTYLAHIDAELSKKWPHNRTVNIACHGHSVPAGYFATPTVDTFNSYPHLLHKAIKAKYPYAVINVINTSIGGENSISGAARFKSDVLTHNPDLILIDYALNDRDSGLARSYEAWSKMIEMAKAENLKVILLTPTLDRNHIPGDNAEPLNRHAEQIRHLAAEYNVALADSLTAFDYLLSTGVKNTDLLSNGQNHPNKRGHNIVLSQILKWFP